MSNNKKLFAKTNIARLLMIFALPIILSYLVQELYNMVDMYFIGNYVSSAAVGGMMVVLPIQKLVSALSYMLAVGTATAMSDNFGANDEEKAVEVFGTGFLSVIAIMLPIFIIFKSAAYPILNILGGGNTTIVHAQEYLGIILFGIIFLSLNTFIAQIMIALGKPKVGIFSTILGASTNVLVDFILVKTFGFGVSGAATATVISQFVAFLFSFAMLYKTAGKKIFKLKTIEFDILKMLLVLGFSSFIIEGEDGIVMAFLNNLLQRYVGDSGVIVLGVATKAYIFLFIVLCGISSAMQPIAAFNKGAENYNRIREVMRTTVKFAAATSTIIWAIMLIFARPFLSLFLKDEMLLTQAVFAFRTMIAFFPLVSIYYVSIYYFQSVGNPVKSLMLALTRQLFIMLPLSFILVTKFNLGATGVWIAYPISDLISHMIAVYLLREEREELKQLILIERREA